MREHFQHVLQQRKFCANVGGTWVFFLAGEQKEMLDDDWRCVDFVVEMWFVEQFWWNKNMPNWLIVILMLILWHGKELARLAVCCNVFCTCPKKHKFASGKLLKLQVFYWGIPLFKLPFAVSSVVFFSPVQINDPNLRRAEQRLEFPSKPPNLDQVVWGC